MVKVGIAIAIVIVLAILGGGLYLALAISRPRRPRSKRCCPMPASRNEAPPVSRRLEAFLEMLPAERGAARLTLQAYRNDLANLARFLAARGESLEDAPAVPLHAYLAAATTRELAP